MTSIQSIQMFSSGKNTNVMRKNPTDIKHPQQNAFNYYTISEQSGCFYWLDRYC